MKRIKKILKRLVKIFKLYRNYSMYKFQLRENIKRRSKSNIQLRKQIENGKMQNKILENNNLNKEIHLKLSEESKFYYI